MLLVVDCLHNRNNPTCTGGTGRLTATEQGLLNHTCDCDMCIQHSKIGFFVSLNLQCMGYMHGIYAYTCAPACLQVHACTSTCSVTSGRWLRRLLPTLLRYMTMNPSTMHTTARSCISACDCIAATRSEPSSCRNMMAAATPSVMNRT
eukprot:363801-Chlamydomonas_euryale.AAC.18